MTDTAVAFGLLILASLPFQKLLPWLHQEAQRIDKTLEKHRQTPITLSIAHVMFGIYTSLTALKGYGIAWLADYYFFDDTYTAIALCATVLLHFWSPWLKLKSTTHTEWVLAGAYTFMDPLLGLYFLGIFSLCTLLINNIRLGQTFANIVMMALVFYQQLPLAFLPATFVLFIASLLYASPQLFSWIEGKKWTILDSFESRA